MSRSIHPRRLHALIETGASLIAQEPLCADPYCLMDGIVRSEGESREAFVRRLTDLYRTGRLDTPRRSDPMGVA